jgi:hypothetical protein
LAQAIERAAAGHGQIAAVVGEAGVGKSRLLWEFMRSHYTHGWLILESGSVSYEKTTPYLPVIELLKSYFRIEDRDGQREIRERVSGKLLTLDRALEPQLTPLLALLDVPVDDAAWAPSTRPNAVCGPWRPSNGCCSGKARFSRYLCFSKIFTGSIRRRRRCSTA